MWQQMRGKLGEKKKMKYTPICAPAEQSEISMVHHRWWRRQDGTGVDVHKIK